MNRLAAREDLPISMEMCDSSMEFESENCGIDAEVVHGISCSASARGSLAAS